MRGVIVNIDVPTLDAGIAFYDKGLGFTLNRTLFNRSVAELNAGATKIYLIEHAEGTNGVTGTEINRTYAPHWTPVHLDVLVDDIERALAKARAAGATFSGEISVNEWGKLATIRDPFGHGVCLLAFQSTGYDSVAD